MCHYTRETVRNYSNSWTQVLLAYVEGGAWSEESTWIW